MIALSVFKVSRPYTHGNQGKLEVKVRFFAVQALSVLLWILQSWMASGTARTVSYLAGTHYLFV